MFRSKLFTSPAKVNLFFCVLGKYVEGLHDVYSVMTTLNFCDYLRFEPSLNDHFFCNHSSLKHDVSNLVIRARDLWRQETKIFTPLKIELVKNIPLGSGLAGGSSNAATTLWAINKIFNSPLSLEKLQQLAFQLGSDVPFFLSSGFSLVTKCGQVIQDLTFLFDQKIQLFLSNDVQACTKDVFFNIKNFTTLAQAQNIFNRFKYGQKVMQNDLLDSCLSLYPKLEGRYKTLIKQGLQVHLSGSGSTFFSYGNMQKIKYNPGIKQKIASPIKRQLTSWY